MHSMSANGSALRLRAAPSLDSLPPLSAPAFLFYSPPPLCA